MSPWPHKNMQFYRANETVSQFDRSLLGCCGQQQKLQTKKGAISPWTPRLFFSPIDKIDKKRWTVKIAGKLNGLSRCSARVCKCFVGASMWILSVINGVQFLQAASGGLWISPLERCDKNSHSLRVKFCWYGWVTIQMFPDQNTTICANLVHAHTQYIHTKHTRDIHPCFWFQGCGRSGLFVRCRQGLVAATQVCFCFSGGFVIPSCSHLWQVYSALFISLSSLTLPFSSAPIKDMRFLRDEVFDFPGHYASLKFCNGDQATPDMVDMVSTPYMVILASCFGYAFL